MTAPEHTAVIPADPVLDGELVDDRRATHRQQPARLVLWWQHSSRIPLALKSRAQAARAARDAAVTITCAPWRFTRAAGRGSVLSARAWRRWVTVRDYWEAAEQSEKLADKYIEIRELTLLRWRVTGGVTGLST